MIPEKKHVVLTKKLNNVIYEIMPKSHADVIYVDKHYKTTLTEVLTKIYELLTNSETNDKDIKIALEKLKSDITKSVADDFQEVWDYLNINGDPKSELIKLIESKQDSEEGKGLSECDFTEALRIKLSETYSKEEIDNKLDKYWDDVIGKFDEIEEQIKDEQEVRAKKDIELENRVSKHNTFMGINPPTESDGVEDNSTWYQLVSTD